MSETLLVVLVLLACPIGMGLMMWYMGRYMHQNKPQKPADTRADYAAQSAEAVRLQAEIDQLKAARRDAAGQSRPAAPPGDDPSAP
ncbi:hypothetical protein SZN_21311 [Streptomyces zinciresistens K42]|uniref:Uncharacterized protein n=1 Tax=Streptomyces zinciresistens K42 TaxID=700597 RepID=G2GFH8_9ACTN|nr:hypothetical protein [Streptomyces zinciresistens]EGX57730.1 hypothetical protein SZN_21311 [Streptomyces zinciresistens K42]